MKREHFAFTLFDETFDVTFAIENEKVIEALRAIFPPSQIPGRSQFSLTLTDQEQPTQEVSRRIRQDGECLMTYERLSLWRLEELSLYDDGASRLVFNRANRSAEGFISAKSLQDFSIFQNVFWPFVFWEMLARKKKFLLHAASLLREDGRVVLLCANSRMGKSTLTLSLAREGVAVLGDDLCCVEKKGKVAGFYRDFHIDPVMADHFSELAFLRERKPYFSLNPKRLLRREELVHLYGKKTFSRDAKWHPVAHLLFPQIEPRAHSTIEPMPGAEALSQVIRASVPIFVEDQDAKDHLAALAALLEFATYHRLRLGRDLYEHPEGTKDFLADFFENELKGLDHAANRL